MTLEVRRLPLIAGIVALTALLAACGENSQTTSAGNVGNGTPTSPRIVEVAMEDIKFDQTAMTIKAGETIDFRFTNNGKVPHDAFIGDDAAQVDHEAEMSQMGDAGGQHMDEAAVVVQPGDSGKLSYTFDQPGTYEVGCHQPGHYAAGMKIDVTVE